MKVSELIEQLQKLNPDLPVYVVADHGQTEETCHGAQENYLKDRLGPSEGYPYYAEGSVQVEKITPQYMADYFEDYTEEEVKNLPKFALVYA